MTVPSEPMLKSRYWPLAKPSGLVRKRLVAETAEAEPGVELDVVVTCVMVGLPALPSRLDVYTNGKQRRHRLRRLGRDQVLLRASLLPT